MDVPWSFVDAAPPVMATFGGLVLDNDDRSIYPSPPAEPLIMDMEVSNLGSRFMPFDINVYSRVTHP